ncbi:S9 family peptidase [Chryseobacterium shandongense]|nr:S9 family peptidase [Chryseobacterium shandongense]
MRRKLAMLILFLLLLWANGQVLQRRDTTKGPERSFFTLGNLEVSADGRWSAVRKRYEHQSDTLLLFDRRKPGQVIATLVKLNQQLSFLSSNRLIASGNGKALWMDLSDLQQKVYDNIRQAGALSDRKYFYLWSKNGDVAVCDNQGKVHRTIKGLQKLITDRDKCLYAVRQLNDQSELVRITADKTMSLYATASEITRMEMMPSGNQIVLTETGLGESAPYITFVNTQSGQVIRHLPEANKNFDYVKVTEIRNGKAYLMDYQSRTEPTKDQVVDIWYGNDNNLKAKKYRTEDSHEYFFLDVGKQAVRTISTDRFPVFASANNTDYLLSFDPQKDYNYSTRFPLLDIYAYNLSENSYFEIFERAADIVLSPDGDFLLGLDDRSSQWILFDCKSGNKTIINKPGLEKPVFDDKGPFIYFESRDGLYRYDIQKQKLDSFLSTRGKEVSIVSGDSYKVNDLFNVKVSSINSSKRFIVKANGEDNRTSYLKYDGKKLRELISPTEHHIREVRFSNDLTIAYTIEENYNSPPRILVKDTKGTQKLALYNGNSTDRMAFDIKQDIIAYQNSQGIPLKGILYYPIGYDPARKYPMVVHIYQIQSKDANVYNYPREDGAGFNWRTLIEQGYFVFVPDIVFDARGTGLSALDCVNSALDGLNSFEAIDRKRIGLTGHSMGGYETNFIATHSDRFATYISSSGHSDIVRAYFSYSYDSYMPLLWQFENGQYKMNRSFFEDKALYFDNNPIHFVDRVNAPILLWTGMKDENVRWDHTMEFYLGLKRSNKEVIALFYPTQEHILEKGSRAIKDLNQRTLEWWDYFLKDKKDVEWINKQLKKRLSR